MSSITSITGHEKWRKRMATEKNSEMFENRRKILFYILLFSWRAGVCWPLLCLYCPFVVFAVESRRATNLDTPSPLINEWMNEWMYEWMCGWMNKWWIMNEWSTEEMKSKNEWMSPTCRGRSFSWYPARFEPALGRRPLEQRTQLGRSFQQRTQLWRPLQEGAHLILGRTPTSSYSSNSLMIYF